MISGAVVNVQDFGAVGDGLADDTVAIQAAIDYCLANRTSVIGTDGGGAATLYFPQGMYVVSSTLNVLIPIGFQVLGDGKRTTQIVFTGSSSRLFNYTTYVFCVVESISFRTGTISFSGGFPQVIPPVSKTNIAFNFNGNGGGTEFKFENCEFQYWDVVFRTKDAGVNDSEHQHNECIFNGNNIIWDNTNTQAVNWSFTDCKIHFTTTTVFNNPATFLTVRGGDCINGGNFLTSSLTGTGSNSSFSDVRFENFQNIDPTSSPKLLILSGTHGGLVFERCSAKGGGSLTGKTSAQISGIFEIIMRDCTDLSGTWDISVSSAINGIPSLLTLDNTIINVAQTVSPSVGNIPINIDYINYPNSTLSRINRYFRSALGDGVIPISAVPMVDAIKFETVVNTATVARSVSVFVPALYSLVFAKVEATCRNNGPATFDLVIWKDSTKAVKLCEILAINANPGPGVFKTDATTFPIFSSTSSPIYIEVISAGNAGLVNAQIQLFYNQV